jgi:hypothetical protein
MLDIAAHLGSSTQHRRRFAMMLSAIANADMDIFDRNTIPRQRPFPRCCADVGAEDHRQFENNQFIQ